MRILLCPLVFLALVACGRAHETHENRPAAPRNVSEKNVGTLDLDVGDELQPHARAPSASRSMASVQVPAYPREAPMPRRQAGSGAKLDLDLKDADLHNVFRMLADVGGVNIVVSDQVKGRVTMRLRRVPWRRALLAIVQVKSLRLEEEGGVFLVMPPAREHHTP